MLFELGCEFRAFRVLHGNEVFDAHCVEHLTTETLRHHTCANTLARRINSCRCTSRTTADDQHFKRILVLDGFSRTISRTGVELRQNLFERHAPLCEGLAVQIDRWHSHDLAIIDFLLVERTINGDMFDIGIERAHEIERLHDIRAILARQREIGLEHKRALQIADLLQHSCIFLGRMTTNLQERQNERIEFMAHRQTGEGHTNVGADAIDRE